VGVSDLEDDGEASRTQLCKKRNETITQELLTYLCTELNPSWEAANCAAIQEIPSNFKEPEGSSSCSQEPFTGPYPPPVRSSPHHPILSLVINKPKYIHISNSRYMRFLYLIVNLILFYELCLLYMSDLLDLSRKFRTVAMLVVITNYEKLKLIR
jgi:hypothetical protein